MEKKRVFWSILSVMMVVMLSIGLSSCSKDDDEDGSGNGNSTVMVDGKSYNLNHAYYDIYDNNHGLCLEFFNVDFYNKGMYDGIFQGLSLDISRYNKSDLQSGTYNADFFSFIDAVGIEGSGYKSRTLLGLQKGFVRVTITKDGDTYTVSIPETTVDVLDQDKEVIGKTSFSFSYTGRLTQSPDDE